jgi:hypothetical protein
MLLVKISWTVWKLIIRLILTWKFPIAAPEWNTVWNLFDVSKLLYLSSWMDQYTANTNHAWSQTDRPTSSASVHEREDNSEIIERRCQQQQYTVSGFAKFCALGRIGGHVLSPKVWIIGRNRATEHRPLDAKLALLQTKMTKIIGSFLSRYRLFGQFSF